MELNEVKKALYKYNPIAVLQNITKDGILYACKMDEVLSNKSVLRFLIPFNDIGDAQFGREENAKYLIRWIITNEKEV